ncbi:hypothetical protein RJ639_004226 [Escallonia herrerae]|uniref:Omega-3 fatty acid desaturase n=1 Tax=Escallonia herrerae TaxID=1293975 RepID=A0AA89AYM7_9ASTE|nr:hypothetical protein RJ639_004226 [Escallonia herrerae]
MAEGEAVDTAGGEDHVDFDPSAPPPFRLAEIRAAIPKHCWVKDPWRSMSYVIRDVLAVFGLVAMVIYFNSGGFWLLYWAAQGTMFWALFVLGHDCGHGSFSDSPRLNSIVGHVLQSSILVPYHGWRISHRTHHQNHGNVEKDESWVPLPEKIYKNMDDLTKFLRFKVPYPLFAFPVYLVRLRNHACTWRRSPGKKGSHFNPYSGLFHPNERSCVITSTFCWTVMVALLIYLSSVIGPFQMLRLYGVPYLIFVMWLDLVTYLHHHGHKQKLPWYRGKEWNYLRGGLTTVDRDYGWLNNIHHDIGTHVVHHLFPQIPHYHLREAVESTEAAKPVLGKYYREPRKSGPIPFHLIGNLLQSMEHDHYVSDTEEIVYYQRDYQLHGSSRSKIEQVERTEIHFFTRALPPFAAMKAEANGEAINGFHKLSEEDDFDPRAPPPFRLAEIRAAIPKHCWVKDPWRALSYVVRDVLAVLGLMVMAVYFDSWAFFAVYWIAQGTLFWALFVLGHDCGHGSFSDYPKLNNIVGHILHSSILVPYHGWRISHRTHHQNHGHVEKDESWVPLSEKTYKNVAVSTKLFRFRVPFPMFAYPVYLWIRSPGKKGSHFNPNTDLFQPSERNYVVTSTICWTMMAALLFSLSIVVGPFQMLKLYGIPYLIFVMWLDFVTYLHHHGHEQKLPWYRGKEWSYLRGGLTTVDRDYGWFNNIHHDIGTHVIHHLFPQIPHYHLREATKAAKHVLGKYYREPKKSGPVPFHLINNLVKSIEQDHYVSDTGEILYYQTDAQLYGSSRSKIE